MADFRVPGLLDRPVAVWILLALVGILGVSGLAGGAQFVLYPSGAFVGMSTAALDGSPFADFLLPGVLLFSILGIYPLVVVYGLVRRRRWSWFATIGVGVALVVWVLVEGAVIGYGERLQYPHLVQGIAILGCCGLPSVRDHLGVDWRYWAPTEE